jgi:hypothetical protein
MDDLRLQAVAARVVAWHNRHPLARRIGVQQVRSVGYVALGVGVEEVAGDEAGALADAPLPNHGSAADGAPPAGPVAPEEDDFAAAFAALAEHHAADAPAAVAADADVSADSAGAAAAPPAAPVTDPANDSANEPVPESADRSAPEQPPAAQPTAPTAPTAPAAHAAAEDSDVATLLAPDLPEPPERSASAPAATAAAVKPAPHIPTLRDRVLVRAQQPAVQGALLTTHEGYRPTVRPRAQAPSWAQAAAEHGEGDHFMAPLSPRDVARWVARHGRALVAAPADGPVRRVNTAAVAGGPAAGTTYVMTAAIAGGGLTSRVLVGAGTPGAVLGDRLWSLPRVATAAALGALLLAATAVATAGWLRPAEQLAEAVPAAASSASSASVAAVDVAASAASAAAASSAETSASSAESATPAAPAANETVAEAAAEARAGAELPLTTVRPVPAYAQKGAVGLPLRGLGLSEADKAAARDAVAAARAGRPAAPREAGLAAPAAGGPFAAATKAESAAAPTAPAAPTGAAPPAEGPVGPSFAISTRALRTRAEAEQLQVAIGALLRTPGAASRRVELLPEGDDWRVVAWPFIGQAEADRVRALLAGRGMKVEVVKF